MSQTLERASGVRPLRDYQAFLDEGRFMLLRSRKTGGFIFYPRVVEPVSGAEDLEWVEACGRGVVYAVTVVSQKPPTPSYNVVLVDLEEGPRMMARVEDISSEEVRIGMKVQARVTPAAEGGVVVFTPVTDAGQSA